MLNDDLSPKLDPETCKLIKDFNNEPFDVGYKRAEFVTIELIQNTGLTATIKEVQERVTELENLTEYLLFFKDGTFVKLKPNESIRGGFTFLKEFLSRHS